VNASLQASQISLREQWDSCVLRLAETGLRQASFALIAIGSILFLTGTDVFLGGRGLLPLPPTVLFALYAALVGAVALVQAVLHPAEWLANLQAVTTRCRWPLFFVFALGAVSLLCAFAERADWSSNGANIFLPVVSSGAVLVGIAIGFIFPSGWLRVVISLALIVAAGSMVVDLVTPGAFSTVMQRAAGFAENANYAAYIVLMHCIVLLRWRSFSVADGVVLVFAGLGVLVTLSRSGLLLFLLMIVAYVGLALLVPADPTKLRRNVTAAVLALGLGVLASVAILSTSEMFETATASNRIDAMLGRGAFFTEDDERLVVLRQYSGAIEDRALLGHGTAYSKTQLLGPHNMYVLQWVNNGIVGLIAYVGLLLSLAACCRYGWRVDGLALVAVIGLAGLFSHDILDQRPFTLVFGMLIARISLDTRQVANSDARARTAKS
jgi:hypothetical protein